MGIGIGGTCIGTNIHNRTIPGTDTLMVPVLYQYDTVTSMDTGMGTGPHTEQV